MGDQNTQKPLSTDGRQYLRTPRGSIWHGTCTEDYVAPTGIIPPTRIIVPATVPHEYL